ncbi:MAG: hypothetical protein RIT27_2360 [Pseudomonadota bacterium]
MKLISTPHFDRAYRKIIRRCPWVQHKIDQTILTLEQDVNASILQTHKLTGKLGGLFACSCGYDCRIVFSVEKETTSNKEFILLIDIGTHEDVY